MRKITAILADKSEIYIRGLSNSFKDELGIEIVAVCYTENEVLEKSTRYKPDVILIDSDMCVHNNKRTIRYIVSGLPKTIIIMLCYSFVDEDILSAMRLGITGFVSRNINVVNIIRAITLAVEGNVIMVPKLLLEFESFGIKKNKHIDSWTTTNILSKRESEVLLLISQGAKNKHIASKLSISENTAKVHVRNIMEKLHAKNRQQAAAWAVAKGLLTSSH